MGIERFDDIDSEERQDKVYEFIDEMIDECDNLNKKELVYLKQELKEYFRERGVKWE